MRAAEIVRRICEHLGEGDWESISYRAFHNSDEETREQIAYQITHLETTVKQLKELQQAIGDEHALLQLLNRLDEEGE